MLGTGLYIGIGIASLGAIINEAVGWRSTVIILSSVSYLLACLCFFLEESRIFESSESLREEK